MDGARGWRRWRWVLLVVLVAALLRAWAVLLLPTDFDEPTYLLAGYHYADALREGNLAAIVNYPENREHPPLSKLLYGALLAVQGRSVPINEGLTLARAWSAFLGTLTALLLAIVDPLAGGLLAIHTLHVKYTSQVYLEVVPALASLAAMLALLRARGWRDGWFWLSAVALGITAAGKFTYVPVGAALLYVAWEKRIRWQHVLLYLLAATAVFFALNPTLWNHPLQRLNDMLFFHVNYSQGRVVASSGYPWYQPLVWLTSSPPGEWHPNVFFYFGFDGLMFWLTLFGLPREWRERRWVVVWLAAGILVLLIWPTKWPQYALVVTPPICLAAATSLRHIVAWLRANEDRWDWIKPLVPRVSPFLWIAIGVVLLGIAAWYAVWRADIAAGQRGWTTVAAPYYDLPNSTVNAVARLPDGRVLLGTLQGLAVWEPPPAEGEPGRVRAYAVDVEDLRNRAITALAVDTSGAVWCGTVDGVVRLRGEDRAAARLFHAADMGLPAGGVTALAAGLDDEVWVGTRTGAARYDGRAWQPFTAGDGLPVARVSAIVPLPDTVWIATDAGVSRWQRGSREWGSFDGSNSPLRGAVAALTVDRAGTVWAGTMGGGLHAWRDGAWETYLTTNSDLPLNTITALEPERSGGLWVGSAFAAQPGGLLSRFDGRAWTTYFPRQTGYSGSEPLDILADSTGVVWVGTRTSGAQRFEAQP